jgi:hypothetical protein
LVEHTTENRGVPGSSPGLAIGESRVTRGFSAFRLLTRHRETGLSSGDEKEMAGRD